jgi:TatA/E family protein of Tat protein translocase
MGSVGLPELIIIFTIALIVFGPRKLPELGKSLGKSIAEFKRASNELKNTLDEEIRAEERKTAIAQQPPVPSVQSQPPQLPQDASHTYDAPIAQSQLTGTSLNDDTQGSVPRGNGSN